MLARVLTSNLGRVLGTLLVIGVAGSTVSYGTFASFTAQTSNTGNTFSTGTLALGNRTTAAGSTCFSTGGGSAAEVLANSTNCGTAIIVAGTGAGLAPAGAVATGQVGIYNSGTLPITTLKLFANACGSGNNGLVPAGQSGAGDLCPKVNISVYEEGTGCVVPSTSAGCTSGSTPPTTTTLANFPTTSGAGFTVKSNMASGSVATYTFAIQVDGSADNSVMGRQATTTFHWFAQ